MKNKFDININTALNFKTCNSLKVKLSTYLRANLFKNQADLYWRVIYDPLRFAQFFESQIFRSLDQTDFFLGNLEKSNFWGEILIIKKIALEIKISQCT